ncbi:hypothetical protein C4K88_09405 [Arthrobacter pityocampae]|uniref:DUF2530 domain-containing protein n=1 Tax=Arthrobacter pityocampae TaxID=547334 RepID=A0A2S5IWK8_9MICC|nr:hypothetical protein [Arthrobacter pityocampae]PPB48946.1 hypothetical protein C4K88_09405 [Arthrobacter pityocampae]
MSTIKNGTRRHPRLLTIVWGSVILVVASLLLVSQVVDLSIDPVIVALGLLVGVGLALVAGGILSLRKRLTADDRKDDDPLSEYR